MIPFIGGTQHSQNHRDQEVEWWLPGTWGERGMGEYCLMGMEFQFYKIKGLGSQMVIMVAQHYQCILYHLPIYLKIVTMIHFILCVFQNNLKNGKKNPGT